LNKKNNAANSANAKNREADWQCLFEEKRSHETTRKAMKNAEKPGFTAHFIRANGLRNNDFEEWLLCSGMLFEALDQWWGIQGKRNKLHEGLDLGFYRNQKKEIIGFDASTRIPTIYDGVIVGIFNDFLGKSIFIKHEILRAENGTLCTIFGHVNPEREISPGMRIEAGEIIARAARSGTSSVRSHLHISMGWAKKKITAEFLDWKIISSSETLKLTDPLEIIGKYSLVSTSTLI
jgi:murein DD-endopeptidase MepM/ murein hydrolase activator NlpD